MKKHYLLFGVLLASSLTIAWQHTSNWTGIKTHMFSSGGQSGLTGAPGEANCTQCHSGSTQSGAAQNILTMLDASNNAVTSYTPGETYTVGLSLTSNPAKKGFSSTALDGTDSPAGSYTGSGIGGTQDFTSAGRSYVSHTVASNSTATPWGWTWVAPATDVGPVTIYVSSNETNDDGSTAGDVIYLSEHTFSAAGGASIDELSKVADFNASFSSTNSTLHISYGSLINGTSNINLVDLNGKSVLNMELNETTIGMNKDKVRIPGNIKNGMYIVHFFVDNVATSKTISIQR